MTETNLAAGAQRRCLYCRREHPPGVCEGEAAGRAASPSSSPSSSPESLPSDAVTVPSAGTRPRSWGMVQIRGTVTSAPVKVARHHLGTPLAGVGVVLLSVCAVLAVMPVVEAVVPPPAAGQVGGTAFLLVFVLAAVVVIVAGVVIGSLGRLLLGALVLLLVRVALLTLHLSLAMIRRGWQVAFRRRDAVCFDVVGHDGRTWQVELLHDGAGIRYGVPVQVLGLSLGGPIHALSVHLPGSRVTLRPRQLAAVSTASALACAGLLAVTTMLLP